MLKSQPLQRVHAQYMRESTELMANLSDISQSSIEHSYFLFIIVVDNI